MFCMSFQGEITMKIIRFVFILSFILSIQLSFAGSIYPKGVINEICNLPTYQTVDENILLFDVGHRYFNPHDHLTNVNITFGYGITSFWDVYVGVAYKYFDGGFKTKLNFFDDYKVRPDFLSLSFRSGFGYKNFEPVKDDYRMSGFAELIVQKHFLANRFTVGLVPTFAYNTPFLYKSDDDYSFGTGVFGMFFLTDRISIVADGIMNVAGFGLKYMTHNIGFKYAGYMHTFTIYVGNSPGYSPVEYIIGNDEAKYNVSFIFTREFDIF